MTLSRKYYGLLLVFIVLFAGQLAHGQLNWRKIVNANTKVDTLQQMAIKYEQVYTEAHQRALEAARQNNWTVREVLDDGTEIELIALTPDGKPIYYKTDNIDAARTVATNKVWPGGDAGLSLDGSGMVVGEWDGGAVRLTHQEFEGRVSQDDGGTNVSGHATHVAGIMIGAGVVSRAKGMAFRANLSAHDWNNANAEMSSAAANNLLISNHSYGLVRGWSRNDGQWRWHGNLSISNREDYHFGFYSSATRTWDEIAYNAPYYLISKSAGNDRSDNGPGDSGDSWYYYDNGDWQEQSGPPPGPDGPYDCLTDKSNAKNILTVGAVHDIPSGYSSPGDVNMSGFSGWGPADDGRVKPDIVANGTGLYSSIADGDAAYNSLSGTSMSSPNAAGSLILLQQHYMDTQDGDIMKAATLKGLALHTTDEAGDYPGPDYRFGWGLLNIEKAAEVISENNTTSLIREESIESGGEYSIEVYADGAEPLIATISWTDPPGKPPAASLDPRTPMLVNDLDLRAHTQDSTYYPWMLDPENTAAPATTGDNYVDNVEKVKLVNPTPGNYRITVNAEDYLENGPQDFSIIVSGISRIVASRFELPITAEDGTNQRSLFIGEAQTGTDGYDPGLDEMAPEPPASGEFDVRFHEGKQEFVRDIRNALATEKIFRMTYQPSTGNTVTLTWDTTAFAESGRNATIVDTATQGDQFQMNMRSVNELTVDTVDALNGALDILLEPSEANQAPLIIHSIGDTQVPLNFSNYPVVELDTVFTEPDNDGLLYTVTGAQNIAASSEGASVLVSPEFGFRGTGDIAVSGSDGQYSISDTFRVEVTPDVGFSLPVIATNGTDSITLNVGTAPMATEGFDNGIDEKAPPPPSDGAFDARIFTDGQDYWSDYRENTNMVHWFEVQYPSTVWDEISVHWDTALTNTLDRELHIFDKVNGESFHLDMSEANHFSADTSYLLINGFNIMIGPSNRPFVQRRIADRILPVNISDYVIAVLDSVFSDPDGDSLRYSASSSNWLTTSVDGAALKVKAPLNQTGQWQVVVNASDGALTSHDTVSIQISDAMGYQVPLSLLDGITDRVLRFGEFAGADDSYNPWVDKFARQDTSGFKAYIASGEEQFATEMRDTSSVNLQKYRIHFESNIADSVRAKWNPEILQETMRKFTLQDTGGGSMFSVNMLNTSHMDFDTAAGDFEIRVDPVETGIERDNGLPWEFTLYQDYPNPFNPVTTIKYGVPENSEVTLSIFDLTGRRIRTLVDRNQEAGWYTYRWSGETDSGNSVSTGIYFYRIQANDYTRVRKMIFIK